ncbi:unnamed protein product [Rotaria sp. Silwood1]|nr:unnamed protein product [Rotaria sp. Silwood1]
MIINYWKYHKEIGGEYIVLHTLNYRQNSYITTIAIASPSINFATYQMNFSFEDFSFLKVIFIVLANYYAVNDDNDTLKIIPHLKQFVDLNKITKVKFLKMNHISRWIGIQLIL